MLKQLAHLVMVFKAEEIIKRGAMVTVLHKYVHTYINYNFRLTSFESPKPPIIIEPILENIDNNKGLVTVRTFSSVIPNTIRRCASGPLNSRVTCFEITDSISLLSNVSISSCERSLPADTCLAFLIRKFSRNS